MCQCCNTNSAHALRDLLARYRDPHLQCPTIKTQKYILRNLIMQRSYGLCRIFFPAGSLLIFVQWMYGHILLPVVGEPPRLYVGRRPGRQAHGQEHRPSSSAPCAVPMRLSKIDQHIKDEPRAKQRALLGVSSSRCSSVSRGVRSSWSIFTNTPLVTATY
jgi:hypothetical protein